MQEDQIKTLMTLVAVDRTGSFAAAARELNTTRATVSRIIGEAEQQLKTRLCHRTTRQVVLTDSAKALVREVARPLDHIAAALASLSEGEQHLQGVIRLSVSHAFGRRYISPLVAQFMHSHPQVSIQMRMRDSIDDVVGQAIDVAVRIGELPDSDLIARSLGRIRVVLVGTPDVVGEKLPVALQDLDHLRAIAYRPVSMRETRPWIFEHQGIQQVYRITNAQVEVDSLEAAADFARTGAGIVMLPYHLAEDDIHSGRLIELLPGYQCIGPDIHLCYASRELIPPRVRALIDFLMRELSKQPL